MDVATLFLKKNITVLEVMAYFLLHNQASHGHTSFFNFFLVFEIIS